MKGARVLPASVAVVELEIEIGASPERVWKGLTEETGRWWPADFHMAGKGSRVTLEARAGGQLLEVHDGGSTLLWYTVQWVRAPQRSIDLAGFLFPAFGGPATTLLTLSVDARGKGSVLRVVDALHGHVEEKTLTALDQGWKHVFNDGLKAHIEKPE